MGVKQKADLLSAVIILILVLAMLVIAFAISTR